MKYFTYQKYINLLLKNQMNTDIFCLQDIYSKKDYKNLLKPVLTTIKDNPYDRLATLRFKIFLKSGLKEIIDNFVKETKITPGLILDFGTIKNRDTILCGNRQEVIYKNQKFIDKPLPIEEDTIFDLASTSKIFTSVAILILNENKTIDVFDPVRKYVPEFVNLENITIYDLLKFRKNIKTDVRIDTAKDSKEALDILYTVYPTNKEPDNAYTDMGAMVLRVLIEKVTKMKFQDFLSDKIFQKCNMNDTFLNVPAEKVVRVANENYSSIVKKDGSIYTRYENIPGTVHDPKAKAMGHSIGISPGHAGFFSCKNDMINFAKALIEGKLINKESLYSISQTETGFKDEDKYTRFYGSLVYLKQPDPKFLSVYPPLSGKSFMSPGFAGTQLVIDPINNITLFIASPRLHNRIYQIDPSKTKYIKEDENGRKTYTMPDGSQKTISSDYTKNKEILVTNALNLAIQYQLLEKLYPREKEMHLVRELN